MSRIAAALIMALASPALAGASSSSVVDPTRIDALPQPPGVMGGAVGGFLNPAAWAMGQGEVAFTWDDRSARDDALDNWGLSFATPLGFAVRRQTFGDGGGDVASLWDYRLGLAWGDRGKTGGLAWRWAAGSNGDAGAEDGLVFGTISRPAEWLSIGTATFLATTASFREGSLDLGIRPLGISRLTLFGNGALTSGQGLDDASWSAGLEVRPVRGLHVGGRVRESASGDDPEWLLNVGVTLGRFGAHVLPAYDADGDRGATSYLVRANPPHAGIAPHRLWQRSPRRLVRIDLEDKRIGYAKDRWFDDDRVAWLDLLRDLREVRRDPSAAGVALDFSGARLRPSIAWELRRELDALRAGGKRVVAHFDNMRMIGYYVAAGADRVTVDPQGTVGLPGIAFQRTYLKGLLEKVGVGFEEHRLFRFKSAAERFTRSDMSDADREQLGRLADVVYDELVEGIATGRELDRATVDSVVDREVIVLAARAQELGLVDSVGRWDDVEEWAKGEGLGLVEPARRAVFPDERWGRPPVVALVYAEGICDVREGIRARATSEHLRRLGRRKDVAAVVLRADSPGGDPLASDLVADGLADVRGKGKPVVVTQGDVAASGGYWISLDADRVLTTPLTITGSIGVISGWAWDAGFSEKTGLSADGVQRGRHADLFGGIRIPFTGVRLPTRNLDAEERALTDKTILLLYDQFVAKVAEMRELPEETVREVAQGRVWSGGDAVDRDLCDGIGGLGDAIDDAKTRAGIGADDEIRIEEFPRRRAFRLPSPLSSVPGLRSLGGTLSALPADDDSYDTRYLQSLLATPGQGRLLVPPEELPDDWKR